MRTWTSVLYGGGASRVSQVLRRGCRMDGSAPVELRRVHCHPHGGQPEPLRPRHVDVADGSGEPDSPQVLEARPSDGSGGGEVRPPTDAGRFEAELR